LDCFVAEFTIGPRFARTRWLLEMTVLADLLEDPMRRLALPLAALSVILLDTIAHAQSEHVGAGAVPGTAQPTVLSVLNQAKDAAESARSEYARLPMRYRVARAAQKTGQEEAFGDYVATAIGAWEAWDPRRDAPDRVALNELVQAQADAKAAFLAGDEDGARRIAAQNHCAENLCQTLSIDALLISWELEAGNLSAAADRVRETDFKAVFLQAGQAERVARAFITAGRRDEGLALLAGLSSKYDDDNRALIAKAYWRLGEHEQGQALMRMVVAAVLDADEHNLGPPPVFLSGFQLAMGDREGFLDTLRRIQQFDAQRLASVRDQLAGELAFAGLDPDALASIKDVPADRRVLTAIATGQARRGDFDAAFATLAKLRKIPPPPPSMPYLPPAENVDGDVYQVVSAIARNAARRGAPGPFRTAFALRQELDRAAQRPQGIRIFSKELPDDRSAIVLRDLAAAGQAQVAIDVALAAEDIDWRVQALCQIAEGLAGVPDPTYDPLAFYQPW
jgi:hypothetical protein